MEKTTVAAAIIILFSVSIGASPFLLDTFTVDRSIMRYRLQANITANAGNTSIGVSPGDNFNFGKVEQNTNITKYLKIGANERKILVEVDARGNITEFLNYEDTHYFSGEKKIPVELVTRGNKTGYYNGIANFTITMPQNQVGQLWTKLKSLY